MGPFLNKLQSWWGARARKEKRVKDARRRPMVELLEHRNLLTGETALGSLAGATFFDFNSNGVRDAGEAAAPGVVVTLQGTTLTGEAVKVSTTSSSSGTYHFSKVQAGVYQITSSNPDVFLAGTGAAGSFGGTGVASGVTNVFVDAGQALVDYNLPVSGVAVGAVSLRMCLNIFDSSSLPVGAAGTGVINADGSTPATRGAGNLTLGGSVFTDTNNNNAVDSGEGLANVRVALTGVETNSNAPVLAFANSSANGSFTFTGLSPGTYNINVLRSPDGFRSGTPTVGTRGGIVRRNEQVVAITLGANQSGSGYLFNQIEGVAPPANTSVPTVVAQLATDSAFAPGTVHDGITRDPSVYGFVSNVSSLGTFEAALDAGAFQNLTNIVGADGRFYLNLSQLSALRDGTLPDGVYTLHLRARDTASQITSSVDLDFELDRTVPSTPTGVALDPNHDANADARTNEASVKIIGAAGQNTTIQLIENGTVIRSVNTGNATQFAFENVSLDAGNNFFTLRAVDLAGNSSADATAVFYRNSAPTVDNSANATVSDAQNAANRTIELNTFFDDVDLTDSIVTFRTNQGNISLELFDRAAPNTVANFFNYITSDRYDDTVFHRLIPGFVLQGGGQKYDENTHTLASIVTDPQIKNEADTLNRSNIRGTVAMAKVGPEDGGGPDTATSQFFINLANNSSNLDNQNGGFTVFGKLATSADQALVDQLATIPTPIGDFPTPNYSGSNFPTDTTKDNFIFVEDVTIDRQNEKLTFEIVSNSRPDLVTAVVTHNNRLTLDYLNAGTGVATIVVRATDKDGLSVTRSFTISII